MNFKCLTSIICIGMISLQGLAQTKTTEALHKEYSDGLSLFFYNNTLRMLNQTDSKEFDDLIKDIEKMQFLIIEKDKNFDFKRLAKGYKSESYEEMMTSRYQGKNFDIYIKENQGKTKGVVILVNDSSQFYVLDIVGSVNLSNVTKLFNSLDENSEIAQKIKQFAKKD